MHARSSMAEMIVGEDAAHRRPMEGVEEQFEMGGKFSKTLNRMSSCPEYLKEQLCSGIGIAFFDIAHLDEVGDLALKRNSSMSYDRLSSGRSSGAYDQEEVQQELRKCLWQAGERTSWVLESSLAQTGILEENLANFEDEKIRGRGFYNRKVGHALHDEFVGEGLPMDDEVQVDDFGMLADSDFEEDSDDCFDSDDFDHW
mmetsp:Transcript_41103/g.64205  ORF Transcript_41103/g.64205 Transcript_41103/m.64205 type:complete len:200 (+) Transcript_41103:33-632(+)|eukprot:CAMPEP_0184310394 /NCGR_PEP_ID=MMETSP1049-20130417/28264_1 /TAXON_ID=77928 /ORGANISM="Proteomonas sulcata, Strain CCMP704" /LENGTH=199 /DNA_ID=CAMNT_0026624425 /DNA_START=14 /DNA_END=613 /DNA_ORIENTATION=+